MTPQQLTDFRIALGVLALILVVGLILIGGLIAFAFGDSRALKRSGKNGVLEIICRGSFRRHIIFAILGCSVLWLFVPRILWGGPSGPLSRVIVLLVVVGAVIAYATTETLDRWKIRFYFRERK